MAFGRQLHQAEGQFRTMESKVRIPQSKVWEFRTPETNVLKLDISADSFSFDIFLCLNFHFLLVFSHSCNSLARKYQGKGKITFLYKFSCKHRKTIFRGAFSRRPTYVNLLLSEIQRSLLLSFSLFYFLFSWKPNTL